ncbi:MAG: 3-deoxy-manno-octulosonate cytidylyltransferase [Hymenobacteraceae bacterium]|nr:3-deoxy-manno-octulosonate cytidylyltransferase [Hymenobacteraceae bacterium]MDX5395115.1 3-deoxy-manno-octulosonate cytidylyltransferase [Hymenobacteraceae bacterium]MDX5443351.1 3-deoxy-manno-octulosonate cytidylyltransferase [Hymenobacteraceae bacterium]MDX5511153.1 3-deoxy-manno-octulosonate cytidylyltransferase [Hymenobacteraceae bacterium]
MKIIGIIPARYASTRFPGKPLADINGKTMIQRVYEQASKSVLDKVLVATDDERIMDHVLSFGGDAMLTATQHQSGTDRCFEAYSHLNEHYDCVLNIQGDEPFIKPEQINTLAETFEDETVQIATLVKVIKSESELFNPNLPKVVLNNEQDAIYFSRHPIPYNRNAPMSQWHLKHTYYKHIGIYGYRPEVLEQITLLEPSGLEISESLEQLRWIENGYTITTAVTEYESMGIDTPDDLERAMLIYTS